MQIINRNNPIQIYPDGNAWCALVGDNIMEGVAAFGNTPLEAITALQKHLIEPSGDNQWTIAE